MDPSYNNSFGSFDANSGFGSGTNNPVQLNSQPGQPVQPTQPMQQFQAQPVQPPIASGGDVILTPTPVSKKNKRVKLLVGAIIGVLVLAGAITAGVLIYNNYQERVKNAKESLISLRNNYSDFINSYGSITYPMGDPPTIDGPSFFPYTEYDITNNESNIELVHQALGTVDRSELGLVLNEQQQSSIKEIKNKAENVLDVASYNIKILKEFYYTFAKPVYDLMNGNTLPTNYCNTDFKSDFVNNEKIEIALDEYEKAYCLVNKTYYDGGNFHSINSGDFVVAKESLVEALKEVSGDNGYSQLNDIVKGVTDVD